MKNLVQMLLFALVCVSCATSEVPRLVKWDSSVTDLRHKIDFYPARDNRTAYFSAILRNVSDRNLKVMVDNHKFESTLVIRSKTGKRFEAFEKDYLHLLQTTTWFGPVVDVPAGGTIKWEVPLDSVVTVDGEPLTYSRIKGATLVSRLPVSGSVVVSKASKIE